MQTYTTTQAGKILGLARNTVRGKCRRGEIQAIITQTAATQQYTITQEAIDLYLAAQLEPKPKATRRSSKSENGTAPRPAGKQFASEPQKAPKTKPTVLSAVVTDRQSVPDAVKEANQRRIAEMVATAKEYKLIALHSGGSTESYVARGTVLEVMR